MIIKGLNVMNLSMLVSAYLVESPTPCTGDASKPTTVTSTTTAVTANPVITTSTVINNSVAPENTVIPVSTTGCSLATSTTTVVTANPVITTSTVINSSVAPENTVIPVSTTGCLLATTVDNFAPTIGYDAKAPLPPSPLDEENVLSGGEDLKSENYNEGQQGQNLVDDSSPGSELTDEDEDCQEDDEENKDLPYEEKNYEPTPTSEVTNTAGVGETVSDYADSPNLEDVLADLPDHSTGNRGIVSVGVLALLAFVV